MVRHTDIGMTGMKEEELYYTHSPLEAMGRATWQHQGQMSGQRGDEWAGDFVVVSMRRERKAGHTGLELSNFSRL